ncbi:hypothetical protein PR048_022069 [Dryococelus australis]|uniref:Uncharacterized protein n=1 Tax=Dryococelus australis TaxID=614101 RepID=A0ABQ9H013_9NEOP|nr:hypothetical protein PR048_022069 [Dryococelus australis]
MENSRNLSLNICAVSGACNTPRLSQKLAAGGGGEVFAERANKSSSHHPKNLDVSSTESYPASTRQQALRACFDLKNETSTKINNWHWTKRSAVLADLPWRSRLVRHRSGFESRAMHGPHRATITIFKNGNNVNKYDAWPESASEYTTSCSLSHSHSLSLSLSLSLRSRSFALSPTNLNDQRAYSLTVKPFELRQDCTSFGLVIVTRSIHWRKGFQGVSNEVWSNEQHSTVYTCFKYNLSPKNNANHSSAYWSLSCVFIGCCPTPGNYEIRKVFLFSCKSDIGSEACRAGLIDCDPIATVTSLYVCFTSILSRNEFAKLTAAFVTKGVELQGTFSRYADKESRKKFRTPTPSCEVSTAVLTSCYEKQPVGNDKGTGGALCQATKERPSFLPLPDQSSDTHKTPYDRVKRYREPKNKHLRRPSAIKYSRKTNGRVPNTATPNFFPPIFICFKGRKENLYFAANFETEMWSLKGVSVNGVSIGPESALSCSRSRDDVIMTSERTLSGRLNPSERARKSESTDRARTVCLTSERTVRVDVSIPRARARESAKQCSRHVVRKSALSRVIVCLLFRTLAERYHYTDFSHVHFIFAHAYMSIRIESFTVNATCAPCSLRFNSSSSSVQYKVLLYTRAATSPEADILVHLLYSSAFVCLDASHTTDDHNAGREVTACSRARTQISPCHPPHANTPFDPRPGQCRARPAGQSENVSCARCNPGTTARQITLLWKRSMIRPSELALIFLPTTQTLLKETATKLHPYSQYFQDIPPPMTNEFNWGIVYSRDKGDNGERLKRFVAAMSKPPKCPAPECKGRGGGNERSPRKPNDQRHCPTRFLHVKIREGACLEWNPVRLGEYTTYIQIYREQGFRKCSIHRDESSPSEKLGGQNSWARPTVAPRQLHPCDVTLPLLITARPNDGEVLASEREIYFQRQEVSFKTSGHVRPTSVTSQKRNMLECTGCHDLFRKTVPREDAIPLEKESHIRLVQSTTEEVEQGEHATSCRLHRSQRTQVDGNRSLARRREAPVHSLRSMTRVSSYETRSVGGHAKFALLFGIKLNFTVLYVLEPASFFHWLLHRCEDVPSLTELHVIGTHNCEVFLYWCRVIQGVSHEDGQPGSRFTGDLGQPGRAALRLVRRRPTVELAQENSETLSHPATSNSQYQFPCDLRELPSVAAVERPWGRGGAVVRLLATHQGEQVSTPRGVAHGFLNVGITSGDATGQRVFSGISRFPPPLHSSVTATYSLRFALIVSRDPDVKAVSEFALSTYLCVPVPGSDVVSRVYCRIAIAETHKTVCSNSSSLVPRISEVCKYASTYLNSDTTYEPPKLLHSHTRVRWTVEDRLSAYSCLSE